MPPAPSLRAAAACAAALTAALIPATAGSQAADAVGSRLLNELRRSYLDLFASAPDMTYGAADLAAARQYLEDAEDACADRFKARRTEHERTLRDAQDRLRREGARLSEPKRHELHCTIQNTRMLLGQVEVLLRHGVPVAFDNREAKLELIEKWPAERRAIDRARADGTYATRRWADVADIGFRVIKEGQERDIDDGQEALRELKRAGLLPEELQAPDVSAYVRTLTNRVVQSSDVQVPVRVTLLDSSEINAFALPGGFLFIERGLLEAVEDEAELAGVIGHEIAHVAARHSHRLRQSATIASIFYEAAQIAAVILTGGAAGIGAYYALKYGFYGVGLAIDLRLLGISREYELEADQLGIQYTWKAGFDPTGFIRFFDQMATRRGYVNGLSWFHQHPPFYQRMVDAQRELSFLPRKTDAVFTSAAFSQMKQALSASTAAAREREEGRPSLLTPEQGCPPPPVLEYKADQPIESLCPLPPFVGTTQASLQSCVPPLPRF